MHKRLNRSPALALLAFYLTILSACAQPTTEVKAASPAPAATSTELDFTRATTVDEAYRARFVECDEHDTFGGVAMTGWRKCSGDPNKLTRLVRFAAVPGLPAEAVVFTSKLGVDYDGSWVAAHTPGMTDQKDTSLEFPGPDGKPLPTDSDTVAYVVLPNSGAGDATLRRSFSDKTGVVLGNIGVVIFGGHVVPIIAADGGPFNKIGEGSIALHRALGTELCRERNGEGICTKVNPSPSSVDSNVTTILFVHSALPAGTKAAAVPQLVHDQALALYDTFRKAYGGSAP